MTRMTALSEAEVKQTPRLPRLAQYAWFVLAYNVGVILWGAYVRGTGSGAGCGAHWPLCNGEIIPQSPGTARLIEFSHRVSSGFALLFVIGLLVWAWRAFPRGSSVRLGAVLSLLFTLTEALVGAGLVLFQLVAGNSSIERAISIAVHLSNTFLLLAALALTALWASGGKPPVLRRHGLTAWFITFGLAGVLLIGVTGAITALGDTLFPSASLAQGLQQDVSPTAQLLVRLRVIHPFIAVAVGVYLILLARGLSVLRPGRRVKVLTLILIGLVLVQWAAGVLNIYLLAPLALQMLHLLLADLAWVALVVLAATVLAQPAEETTGGRPLSRLWRLIAGVVSDS